MDVFDRLGGVAVLKKYCAEGVSVNTAGSQVVLTSHDHRAKGPYEISKHDRYLLLSLGWKWDGDKKFGIFDPNDRSNPFGSGTT